MNVNITFRHLESTPAIKTHVTDKLEILKKYLIRPIEVHVILSVEKFRQQCEIVVKADHFHGEVIEINDDLYTSIDRAVHKISQQVRKHKEKIKTHKDNLPVHDVSAEAEEKFEQSQS